MFYPSDILEEIRTGNDIVDVISSYVLLKQKGNNFFGLCPFHNEKSPSFSVSPDKQIFYCFGCGATGNVYSFIMQMENHNFVDTVKLLAERINFKLPTENISDEIKKNSELKSRLYELNTVSARFFYNNLISDEGVIARKYLENRKINVKVQKKYGLGYSKNKNNDLFSYLMKLGYDLDVVLKSGLINKGRENTYYDKFQGRLIFPIFDPTGRIIGFGGRSLDKREPKYLNSPDTLTFDKSRSLYSINYARLSKAKEFIIVEGYLDVISLYQSNFENVVAALGTAFTDQHAKLIKKYTNNVIILFDNDEAGLKATLRTIPILTKNGLEVKVAQTIGAKDPDEFIGKYGRDEFSKILQNAKSYISFQIELIKNKYNLSNTDEKVAFTKEVATFFKTINNSIELDIHIKELAELINISENTIRAEVNKEETSPKVVNDKYKENLSYIKKNNLNEKGIQEARKKILKIFIEVPDLREELQKNLTEEELIDETYIELYKLLKNFYNKNNVIYPAEILNYFETVESQKKISEIFVSDTEFKEKSILEKAVNDLLKKIKRWYIDEKVSSVTDANELQKLIEIKRNIEKLYITL